MDARRLAAYPFLAEARTYVKEKGFSIADLLSLPPDENYALQDAWNRVFGAFAGRISFVPRVSEPLWGLVEKAYRGEDVAPSDVKKASENAVKVYSSGEDVYVPSSEEEALSRILSYPLARIMVSCIGDRRFMKRYALKEAELFRELLRRDFEETGDMAFLQDVGKELGLNIEIHEEWAAVDIVSYVKNTAQMKDRRKSLLFQDVRKGMVYFRRKEGEDELQYMSVIFRSLQQALYNKLDKELPLEISRAVCGEMFVPIRTMQFVINDRYENYSGDLGVVDTDKFPPCMKKLLGMAKEGVNLPHSGRFALTAFLHLIGMGIDDIVGVFSASPDFKEDLTRYQVKHIAGEISGTEYTPQKCNTLITEGLCYKPDDLCAKPWMNHPLTYYRVKKGWEKKGRMPSKHEKARKGRKKRG